jgi:hypothetical protein
MVFLLIGSDSDVLSGDERVNGKINTTLMSLVVNSTLGLFITKRIVEVAFLSFQFFLTGNKPPS